MGQVIERTLSTFPVGIPCSKEQSEGLTKHSWKIALVDQNEPGEPLVVSGTVYAEDGFTTLEGVTLYVYQTDASGHYSKDGRGSSNPRIKGWIQTNAEGKYEFRTIKPAPYPGRRLPAHIHCKVSGGGYPEQWVEDFLFEGDTLLRKADYEKHAAKGRFSSIMKIMRDKDGVLRAVRDIMLKKS